MMELSNKESIGDYSLMKHTPYSRPRGCFQIRSYSDLVIPRVDRS